MVEVIEKGTQKPYVLKHRCTGKGNGRVGCKALLRLDRADLRYFEGTDYPFYRPDAVMFRCPDCGTCTDIAENKWPSSPRDLKPFTAAWMNGKKEKPTP